ncbi:MAG: peptidylprolyl isomerase [Robiginitomaculum sp.]|nr:MAG: peptidylprolyl isomerase [Robiginitomaculum sp.]
MKLITLTGLGLIALIAACSPANKDAADDQDQLDQDQITLDENASPAEKNLAAGTAFLEQNKKKRGIKVTDSGLQYKVLTSGPKGGEHPFSGQFVCVNYQGTSLDGKEFDSSYKRGVPAVFPSNRLVKGWVEALSIMRPGDEWMLYIAPELAYGRNGTMGGPIGPNETLVFKINLIKLMDLSMDEYRSTYAANPALDCSKSEG